MTAHEVDIHNASQGQGQSPERAQKGILKFPSTDFLPCTYSIEFLALYPYDG